MSVSSGVTTTGFGAKTSFSPAFTLRGKSVKHSAIPPHASSKNPAPSHEKPFFLRLPALRGSSIPPHLNGFHKSANPSFFKSTKLSHDKTSNISTLPHVSYQVFARKYRPKTFDDVLGQDHVVRTLRNAITQKRLAHAYLFVGPRGTGKTSTARILAKALNCTGGPRIDFDPDEDVCIEIAEGRSLDVLEIDGASNNGVEQVRDLRESVRFAPARGQFKIFYIDEVHMLSNAAFNALLKTLEEPPPHVKFIFATTEANKILPTILSRCQRFDLRPISTETIAEHLLHIAKMEGINLDQTAAWAIGKGADGGMRDAQSMLDQLVAFCGDHITEDNVLDVFGFTSREKVANLTTSLLARDTPAALSLIQKEAESGRELSQLLGELIGCLRALLVAKLDPSADGEGIPAALWSALLDAAAVYPSDRILAAIDVFAETEGRMKWATNKRLHFELGVIKSIQSLGEVRITDVIKALTRGADLISNEKSPAIQPPDHATPEEPTLQPTPEPEPVQATPEPEQAAKPKASLMGLAGLDSLIDAAPEISAAPVEPEPPPWKEEPKPAAPVPPTAVESNFHHDPLIESALTKFEGKIVSL
ncbi:MAG: DNA polymerase III subunit gamma/tau [Gloeobacteraceae cyanobacterium ES-bin-144]|nr:DNA polymerase III subunit gamma/tau [Verrucomicrobiales bacterium]